MAARVQDRWVVTCEIEMKKVNRAGEVTKANGLSFVVGDFVEVECMIDVVSRRGYRKGTGPKVTDMRFRLTKLTKLVPASEVLVGGQEEEQVMHVEL